MSSTVRLTRCAILAACLQVLLPRLARCEDAVSYKFQSWQEAGSRIRVDSHYALLEQGLPHEARLKLIGTIDSIAGASPTGEAPATPGGPVPLAQLKDRRKAWQIDLDRTFGHVDVSLGYAHSRESDYVSNGWSVNTLTDFNQKNTTILAGIGGTDDDVKVFYQPKWEKKYGLDAIVGLTQLLDSRTSVSLNFTYSRSHGYLNDQYKVIQKTTQVGPDLFLLRDFGENRPDQREKWIAYAGLNRSFADLGGALEASYRYYHDNFGINSHTASLEWYQKIWRDILILRPSLRFYEQSAANFYRLTLDGTPIVPGIRPNPSGPFYSADYRLSKLRTITYGLKTVWNVLPTRLAFDASYERYNMRGRDAITSSSAYPQTNIFTLGGKVSW